MPFHIVFQVLIFLFGIVFFLCGFFAAYHEIIHRVCLPCGNDSVKAKHGSVSESETLPCFIFLYSIEMRGICKTLSYNSAAQLIVVVQICLFLLPLDTALIQKFLPALTIFVTAFIVLSTVFPAWNHGKAPLSTQTKTTALSGPTAAKMHLRPNDCGCLWISHRKSRKHPTIHRSFISCPVILFLLYLFCAEMSAGFL